ncbi:5-formyltetrahydrofolate cyclo-ligase [Rickettsia endosymbiont of Halotydeus destructor]|uniref:5-formyltetrahydrofolate cyclo-ligase n=1 Tax=Rickettsia endosymbiont of Halotydeus destructor TaxID=2996754 RepID=UPI003BAEC6BA
MDKPALRYYFRNFLRKNKDKINSEITKKLIINKLNILIDELKVTTIGVYYPLLLEINILEIIKLRPELTFFLPKIVKNEISYGLYTRNTPLILNRFNIYEPKENSESQPELIVIPALAFNMDNHRLGQGFGFFDRYINNDKNLITIGVCLKEQLIDNLPIMPHDRKLNFIVTD